MSHEVFAGLNAVQVDEYSVLSEFPRQPFVERARVLYRFGAPIANLVRNGVHLPFVGNPL
jgi:hypothetical protein